MPPGRIACIAAIAVAATSPLAAAQPSGVTTLQPGVLTVCTFTGFPPTSYTGPGGGWAGHDARFITAFATSRALAVRVLVRPFSDIWTLPGTGECDVAAAGITRTDARVASAPGSSWSATYHTTVRAFVVRRGTALTGVRDLAGRTVIVGRGTVAEQDVRRRVSRAGVQGVRIRLGSGEAAARRAVLSGAVFAYETDDVSAAQAARSDRRLAVAWKHPLLDSRGRNVVEPLSFVVRAASTGLLPALDAFIAANAASY